jgi:hypothetical protein
VKKSSEREAGAGFGALGETNLDHRSFGAGGGRLRFTMQFSAHTCAS